MLILAAIAAFILLVFLVAVLIVLAISCALYFSQFLLIVIAKVIGEKRQNQRDIVIRSEATVGMLLALQFANPVILFLPAAIIFHYFDPSWEAINLFSYGLLVYSVLGMAYWIGFIIFTYHKEWIYIKNQWLNVIYFCLICSLFSLASLVNLPSMAFIFYTYQQIIANQGM